MQSANRIGTRSLRSPSWRLISHRSPALYQAELSTPLEKIPPPPPSNASTPLEKIPPPPPSNASTPISPKIEQLCSEITKLNLIEVGELSALLKKRLNLPDAPMMAAFAAPAAKPEEEEEEAPKPQKASFTVKLTKFDDKQKVALIKEIKAQLEGMNLVQAKKFVESAPVVVKADIAKDEAEKLKEALTKVGATIEVE